MSTATIVIHSLTDRTRVCAFMKKVNPRGFSVNFSGKYPTWLLKPTIKGGDTIGKIIDASGSDQVTDMSKTAWDDVNKAPQLAPPAKKKGVTA